MNKNLTSVFDLLGLISNISRLTNTILRSKMEYNSYLQIKLVCLPLH